jgi:large subunit ribosomal protein L4
MATVDIYNKDGRVVGSCELDDGVFGVPFNEHIVHAAVVAYLANQRQGTKSAKTRAEVRGGGAKPRPQKGTGRSRQGSIRSPQWVGGGLAFAPKPRDFSIKLNKKLKRLALKSVLTGKVQAEKLIVLDELALNEIKTKNMVQICGSLNVKNALLVTEERNMNIVLSARNIPGIKTAGINTINVYDILNHENFVVTKQAVEKMQEVYA